MDPVALGLSIYGAVNTSIALIDRTWSSLVSLRERWRDAKNVPVKLHELVKLSVQIKKGVEGIEAKLKSYPPNELERIASGVIEVFQDKLQKNVKEATTALENLDRYKESSAGPSSRPAKFRNQVRMSSQMKSISGALSKVEACLSEALDAVSNILLHLKPEATLTAQIEKEKFMPHFDCPELPDNVLMDFSSMETQEGRLLGKLLGLRENENVNGMSAVGRGRGSATHGMGGVGKTTALRAICYEEEVKKAFPDGICFLEFGENATDIIVRRQVERCIANFGGVSIVAKMEQQSSSEGAIHQAARWLRKREVLFVCDDLWRSPTNEYGYLPLLKGLLVNAPRSKLLISTRDERIAEYLSKNIEPFGTLPAEGLNARNLVGLIVFRNEQTEVMNRPDIQGHIRTILKVCAGLQLALCMAGHALRTAVEELDDILRGFEVYASRLEADQRPDDAEGSAQLYDHGLAYIVNASLSQCELWAVKSLPNLNVQDLFRSLCVLEKQTVMPKSMLSNLWGISSRETDHVVRKFANLGLLSKTKYEARSEPGEDETVEDYGVRLHDLILVLCQEMVGDGQKQRHQKFIDALKQSKSVWIDEAIPKRNE